MSSSMIGIVAALGSTASWALCGVLFKKLGERLDPVGMTTVKSLVAALFLAPLLFFVGGAAAGGRDLLWLAASGIIGIAIGDCFFFAALGQLSPLLLTVLLLTCPNVFTGILGVLCLGEMIWGEWMANEAVDVFLSTNLADGLDPLADFLREAAVKVEAIRPS